MKSISEDDFGVLLTSFEHEAIHLEQRDSYGTAIELPYMAKWQRGESDDLAWLQEWCDTLRGHRAAARSVRRARVVSEPLSEYQQWSHSIAHPMVEAGEDIRWVPRKLVCSLVFPGNDYYLFDNRLVVFLIYAGNGLAVDRLACTDATVIKVCRESFEAVWTLSVPHRDYRPT
jgi:hypothetical protein